MQIMKTILMFCLVLVFGCDTATCPPCPDCPPIAIVWAFDCNDAWLPEVHIRDVILPRPDYDWNGVIDFRDFALFAEYRKE